MVKVRNDGPRGRRWITLARAWWLENRGPIPPGMRDGDPLNDDPANYMLATAGDVAYLAREWDPDLDRRNAEACRVATVGALGGRARGGDCGAVSRFRTGGAGGSSRRFPRGLTPAVRRVEERPGPFSGRPADGAAGRRD
jgi:hypothetical protein